MSIVGFDKMSLLDYEDKVSCVIFFKACNFRCPFCHNGLTVIKSQDNIDFSQIKAHLNTRRGIIDAVVFSGGEATLCPELPQYIKEVKDMGFLVKLDTNGTNSIMLKELIDNKLLDYVAMDMKNCLDKYSLTTGTTFDFSGRIKESVEILLNSGVPYEFRTTLIKEFHSLEDMEPMGNLIKGADKLFLQKFVEREGCFEKGLHEVDKNIAEQFKAVLEKYVKNVSLRGY